MAEVDLTALLGTLVEVLNPTHPREQWMVVLKFKFTIGTAVRISGFMNYLAWPEELNRLLLFPISIPSKPKLVLSFYPNRVPVGIVYKRVVKYITTMPNPPTGTPPPSMPPAEHKNRNRPSHR